MAAAVTPAREAISFMVAPSKPCSAQAAVAASSSLVAVSRPSELGGRPRRGGIACIMNGRSFKLQGACAHAARARGGAMRAGGASPAPGSPALLEVDDVHYSYGPVPVLFGVSFSVEPGEILGLLGTNGAGKS